MSAQNDSGKPPILLGTTSIAKSEKIRKGSDAKKSKNVGSKPNSEGSSNCKRFENRKEEEKLKTE